MDKTFFAIVRRFGLIVAFVTLLGAIGGLTWAVYSYNSPVNENIAEPKVQYKDFKQKPTDKTNLPGQEDSTPTANEPAERTKVSEFDRRFDAHLQRIMETAAKYLQPELNLREDGLRASCKGFISQLPEKNQPELGEAFMAQFEAATASFVGDASNSSSMNDPSTDKGRRWNRFSEWMFRSFRSQISEETQRIENEKLKAQLRKTQAGAVAAAAGISFVVFMLFTLMLVLLAIERNTRQQPKTATEEQPTPRPAIAA